ncbi:MAG: M23 family metallopeptidase, partial [Bacteroidota bacterium]
VIGDVRHHDGVDLAAPLGTPALATASGVVAWSGVRGGYGLTVDVRHPQSGLVTRYAHLDAVAPGIAPGVPVSRGAVLGFVGETGLATGPHLHYEVRSPSGPLDPVALTERYGRSYAEARDVHGRAWNRWATAQRGGAPGGR